MELLGFSYASLDGGSMVWVYSQHSVYGLLLLIRTEGSRHLKKDSKCIRVITIAYRKAV